MKEFFLRRPHLWGYAATGQPLRDSVDAFRVWDRLAEFMYASRYRAHCLRWSTHIECFTNGCHIFRKARGTKEIPRLAMIRREWVAR
ncbi:hypothetical protein GCM10023321_80970 [Pseudonocardia eucalypti]|uniref:Uncharacterized protein n=1 Tax=Pseudonocardia eucalypti TaxID=648755 RepID=A0ABP9RD16_9PSEU